DHGHDHGHDHAHADLKLALLPMNAATDASLAESIEPAVRAFAEQAHHVGIGEHLAPGSRPHALEMGCHGGQYCIDVPQDGAYALFVEHAPDEFGLALTAQPVAQRRFASHHHEEEIRSVGLTDPRPLNARKVNDWLSYLLEKRGQDIFRMKGVLNIRGDERRYVFHGVHMMFEGRPDRPWGDATRASQLVFIGRGLDREELETGFANCIA
ncbi:GTP-binding protein, partial [bacterium]